MERAIRPEGTPEHAMPLSFPSMNLQTPESCDPVAISQQEPANLQEPANTSTSWQEPANLQEPAIPQQLPGRNLQTRGNVLSHSKCPTGNYKLAGTCYHTAHTQQKPANSQEPAINSTYSSVA
jgi:hypothetical protein